MLAVSLSGGPAFAAPPAEYTRVLREERVDLGEGESVTLRFVERRDPGYVDGPLAPEYARLAAAARAGDVLAVESLIGGLRECERAHATRAELDAAIALLRKEGRLQWPGRPPATLRSALPVEVSVERMLVAPYVACEGLTPAQRASRPDWIALGVGLGSAEAAMAALDGTTDRDERRALMELLWRTGHPGALAALAEFHEERSRTRESAADDLVRAYAYRVAHAELAKFAQRLAAPGPMHERHYRGIVTEMERVGALLRGEEKQAAVKLAAELLRTNANCCWPP